MSDIKKSALWALISIPIFFLGFYIGPGLVETGSLLLILYIPTFVVWSYLQNPENPEWVVTVAALTAQYLWFFLFIYVSIKTFKKISKTISEKYPKEPPPEEPTDIWDLFHDGTIKDVQENTRGNLVLTIELEYVRERFDEEFKYFLLELHESSLFEYFPSIGDIKAVKDLPSILKYDLWMTDVEKKNDQILVYCADGILKTKYKDYSIFLDTGTKVSTHDLGIKLDEAVEKAINSKENTGKQ